MLKFIAIYKSKNIFIVLIILISYLSTIIIFVSAMGSIND